MSSNTTRIAAVLLLFTSVAPLSAVELTGRLGMAGVTSFAAAGDGGYTAGGNNNFASDQETVRLMAEGGEAIEWSLHYRAVRLASDTPATAGGFTTLFRADPLRHDLVGDASDSVYGYQELDWLTLRKQFDNGTLTVGRQPLTWGSGRIWQPLDIFGAFAPLALDTEYKPGIDALVYDYFPSAFSSITAAWVQTPLSDSTLQPGKALHYRGQLGETTDVALLGAELLDHTVIGGGLEGAVAGIGVRWEGIWVQQPNGLSTRAFWIAGADYQFNDGTLLIGEWYHNGFGAAKRANLAASAALPTYPAMLAPHLGRDLLGLSLSRDLTPLLQGGYSLLVSTLSGAPSQLHQLTLHYSISDESDAQLAWAVGTGDGLNGIGIPQSEFGHLPQSLYLRIQFYF